jgi:Tol biopolymer transport system component/tRNA A-37 threonylcarbamoyl transferase component Bud32
MGEVYRARDPRLGREVAIKVLRQDRTTDPDRQRRFAQEAKAAGALNHPNVLVVFDTGEHEGAPFVVFELLEGETLRRRLAGGALPPRKALDDAIQIASGLAAAHEKGIVHRDLKPENLFLTRDGRIKILDFGLAKLRPSLDAGAVGIETPTATVRTEAGTILGTLGYMSPEQVRRSPADHRSDIFSLGSILFEMLTGRRAFRGDTEADTMAAILNAEPPALAEPDGKVPPAFERVVRHCLEKRPEDRFQSARDVAFALEAVRDAGPTKRPGLPWPGPLAALPRKPQLAVAAVAGLLAASLLASRWLPPRTTPQITGSAQLTFTDNVAAAWQGYEWLLAIFTDGARVYFTYFTDASSRPGPGPAYVSRAGGEVVRIPSPVERGQVLGLSPDGGRLLVKEWLNPLQTEGALWVVSTSGRAPKRLGDVMAHDAAWSPDGQSLLYARGEELYLSRSDGAQARRLATTPGRAHWIRWSPDGRHLRFTLIDAKGHRRSLWEVSADGTDLHVLPFQWGEERPQECCGEWSRDGRHFVFTAVHEQGAALWMVDETAAVFRGRSWNPRRLTSDSFVSVAAVPSVDGKELYAVEARATARAALRYDPRSRQLAAFPFPNAGAFGFSRDGQWLVFVEFRGTKGTLKRSRLDGSQALELTDDSMEIWTPRWSPDGTQIAFTGKRPGQPYKAYLVSRDGSVPQPVLAGERNEVDPEWSPDGRSLMFGRPPDIMAEAGSAKAIHILDLKTKQVSTLPHSEGLFSPRWSPDGRYVVAMALDCSKLVIFDFKTAEWRDLAGPGIGIGFESACRPPCNNPQWSPDGRYVYVESAGTNVIRVTPADRRAEQVLEVTDLGPTVRDFVFNGLTPDGSVLVVARSGTSDIHALEWRVP